MNTQTLKIFLLSVLFVAAGTFPGVSATGSHTTPDSRPEIGAQVFIEPGQSEELINSFFRTLQENGMSLCRIRMFESYMHTPDGGWDFTLFDKAFRAAERYHIGVYATLFPLTPFEDVGGFKFPHTREHMDRIAEYIRQTVMHFRTSPALRTWVIINEPGTEKMPFGETFTDEKFRTWKAANPQPAFGSEGYPNLDLSRDRFIVDYQTWYLEWLAEQVRKHDSQTDLHVNPHAIFSQYGDYDFPAWRSFLSTFGGSAHASWHFGLFPRNGYAVAMSANSEMIRSGAGELPWLMTELQGGNNLYSGGRPMCPTAEETTQWLWTVFASGGKAGIFWSLNPRATAAEAGEWAMISLTGKPSDRLDAASGVARCLSENGDLFARARVAESGVCILYNRESRWVEEHQARGRKGNDGRSIGATITSPLAYFEALSEMGIQANMREIREFDFSQPDYTGRVLILAHQVAIPRAYRPMLEEFVLRGGKLVVDGLSAFYDEYAHCSAVTDFAYAHLFGARPEEFKLVDGIFRTEVAGKQLPASLWRCTLELTTAEPIGSFNGIPTACRNGFGRGEVVWIPELIGLGARNAGSNEFAAWLRSELPEQVLQSTPRFETRQPGMLMKSLRNGPEYVSVVINKSGEKRQVKLWLPGSIEDTILFADKQASLSGKTLVIDPEESVVIRWKKR